MTPFPPQVYYLPPAALSPNPAGPAEITYPARWEHISHLPAKPLQADGVPIPLYTLPTQSGQRRASDPAGVYPQPTTPFATAYDAKTQQTQQPILFPFPVHRKLEDLEGWNEHLEVVQELRDTLHSQNTFIDNMRDAIDHALAIEEGRAPRHSHPNTPGYEDMLLNSNMRQSAKGMADVLRGARGRLRGHLRNPANRDTHHEKINALHRAEEAHRMMWEALHEIMGTVPSLQAGLARYYTPATTESLDADIEAGEAALAAGEVPGEGGSDDEWDHVAEEQDSDITLTGDEEEYYWSDDE